MTTPVMHITGATAPIGLSPYAAILKAKAAANAASVHGAGFVARIIAKLHLGAFGTWATRAFGFVVGRVSLVVNFFGTKTSIAYVVSSATGQALIKGGVRLALKPVAWLASKAYAAARWALRKIKCEQAITVPVSWISAMAYSVSDWTGNILSIALNPESIWMQAIHTVAAFRVHWALATLSFIPGPIGFVFKAIALVVMVTRVVMLIGGFIGFREEDAIAFVEEAIVRTEESTETLVEAANLKVADTLRKAEARVAEAKRLTDELVEELSTDESVAMRFLDENGAEVTARAVLDGKVPAVTTVMSKNQAKGILRDLALEKRILKDVSK